MLVNFYLTGTLIMKRRLTMYVKQRIVGCVLFLVAIALIIVGIAQGDYTDTLRKATIVCLECIGIG